MLAEHDMVNDRESMNTFIICPPCHPAVVTRFLMPLKQDAAGTFNSPTRVREAQGRQAAEPATIHLINLRI